MKNYLLLALVAVALCFTACKKDNPGADKPKVVAVTGVSLNTNAVALEVDDSVTLTATVAPANATNKGVEWSVADDAIATVKNGVVKAVAIGETTVTVTTVDGGFTASATITVAEGIIKVTGVTLDKPSLELEIGDSDTLTATVAPDNATNKAVSWSSANDAIATVEDGVVTAVAAGETTVTVTTADGAFKATANVVVKAAPIKVTGVSLDKTMVTLEIGKSVTVEATVTPENATNKAVEWSIADTAVATVSNGVVTGVAEGETELTVTTADGGHTATIPVKVVAEKVPVTGISFTGLLSTGDNPTLKEGQFGYTFVMFTPENATNKNLTFTCDKPELVSIQEDASYLDNGFMAYTITAIKAGEVEFTAVSEDGGFTITKTMTILPIVKVSSITISPETTRIKVGETKQLTAAVLPNDADNKEIEWSSSDTSVATVDANGLVTGVAKGEVTITATAKDGSGVKGTAKVTVSTGLVESIAVDPSTCAIEVGSNKRLKATVSPSDADNQAIEWSSSNTSVATVDANGLVTGVAKGEVTITATAKDGSGVKGIATITVIETPTSVTFDGKTDQEIYTWWGKEVDLKAEVTPEGVSLKHLTWRWNDPNSSKNPDGLKYNVTDDKATLTYTWPSQTSRLRGVDVRAFYGDGNTVYAEANVYFQTFAWLLEYSEDAIDYEGLYPLGEDFDYKWNWEDYQSNKLAFIAYYRSSGSENAMPNYYKEYYIPTSEYTLTSSDESKIKVTKSADGESWEIERLNTTDLAAVTLTYKCGSHTETYTLNLIP